MFWIQAVDTSLCVSLVPLMLQTLGHLQKQSRKAVHEMLGCSKFLQYGCGGDATRPQFSLGLLCLTALDVNVQRQELVLNELQRCAVAAGASEPAEKWYCRAALPGWSLLLACVPWLG